LTRCIIEAKDQLEDVAFRNSHLVMQLNPPWTKYLLHEESALTREQPVRRPRLGSSLMTRKVQNPKMERSSSKMTWPLIKRKEEDAYPQGTLVHKRGVPRSVSAL
jgi:hypothetical protein